MSKAADIINSTDIGTFFGAGGVDIIDDNAVYPGPFIALLAVGGDAVIASAGLKGAGTITAHTIPDEVLRNGIFSNVQRTSGTMWAYRAAESGN